MLLCNSLCTKTPVTTAHLSNLVPQIATADCCSAVPHQLKYLSLHTSSPPESSVSLRNGISDLSVQLHDDFVLRGVDAGAEQSVSLLHKA